MDALVELCFAAPAKRNTGTDIPADQRKAILYRVDVMVVGEDIGQVVYDGPALPTADLGNCRLRIGVQDGATVQITVSPYFEGGVPVGSYNPVIHTAVRRVSGPVPEGPVTATNLLIAD